MINRSLVWAVLSGLVVAGFAGHRHAAGRRGRRTPRRRTSRCVATVVVALLALPLRDRVQAAVNRLMYGAPQDPYSVLAGLAQRLAATPEPDGVLPAAVDEVAVALQRPYAAIELASEDGPVLAAEHGDAAGARRGARARAPGRARRAAAAGGPARREPRRRAPGRRRRRATWPPPPSRCAGRTTCGTPASASSPPARRSAAGCAATCTTASARRWPASTCSSARARTLLAHAPGGRARGARRASPATRAPTVADVRRLVNGLRPPALDDLGLAFAIREQAERLSRPVDGPPLDVEVTVEGDLRGAAGGRRGRRVPHRAGGARQRRAPRRRRRAAPCGSRATVRSSSWSRTTAAGSPPRRARASAWSPCGSGRRSSGVPCRSPRGPARGTVVRALLPVNDRPEES